jgi:hypothetical protein
VPLTGLVAMMAAIEADDPAAIERCWVPELATGMLPTKRHDTCLTYSCRGGSLKAVKWLI